MLSKGWRWQCSQGSIMYYLFFKMLGTGWCEVWTIVVGHHPPTCLPSVCVTSCMWPNFPGLPHLCLHTTSNDSWSWQRLLKPQWLARGLLHPQSSDFNCSSFHMHYYHLHVSPGCLQVGGILQEPWSALCIWYHLLPWLQPHWEVCTCTCRSYHGSPWFGRQHLFRYNCSLTGKLVASF